MKPNIWTYVFDKETGTKLADYYGPNSEKRVTEFLKEHNIDENDVIIYEEDRS